MTTDSSGTSDACCQVPNPAAAERPAGQAASGAPVPAQAEAGVLPASSDVQRPPAERGGPKGPEPTRYGDWEVGGLCSDF